MNKWSEWIIHSLNDCEKIKLVNFPFIQKCSIQYSLLPLKQAGKHPCPWVLNIPHAPWMWTPNTILRCVIWCHFLLSSLVFPGVPNSISGTVLCFTIVKYPRQDPNKRNSRGKVDVNLVQRSAMYNILIIIFVTFRDSWSLALKK